MAFAAAIGIIYLFSYHHIVYHLTDSIDARNAIGSMIVFSILSFFSQPAVRISTYAFIGLGKSIYSLFSVMLNVSLFVVFMLIGTLLFNSRETGIFVAVILADIVEVIVMLRLIQRSLRGRIEEETTTKTPAAT